MKSTKEEKKSEFRISAKTLFLTYPYSNIITKETVKEQLEIILEDREIQWIICSEEETEEYRHVHALLEMRNKLDTRDPKLLNIKGIHGNYQSTRSKKRAIHYVCKDGDFISEGINVNMALYKQMRKPFDKFLFRCKVLKENPNNILQECRDATGYKKDLFEMYADYLTSPRKYEKLIKELHPPEFIENNFLLIHENLLRELIRWCRNRHESGVFRKVLFIQGKSGSGKTTLSLQLSEYKARILRHKDAAKELIEERHEVIIFDDMDFSHESREYAINLVDMESSLQLDVKGSMVEISNKKPRILTSNNAPEEVFKDYDEAIERRIHLVDIDKISRETEEQPIYFKKEDIPIENVNKYHSLETNTINKILEYIQKDS